MTEPQKPEVEPKRIEVPLPSKRDPRYVEGKYETKGRKMSKAPEEEEFEGVVDPAEVKEKLSQFDEFSISRGTATKLFSHPEKPLIRSFTPNDRAQVKFELEQLGIYKEFNKQWRFLREEASSRGCNKKDSEAYAWYYCTLKFKDQVRDMRIDLAKARTKMVDNKIESERYLAGKKEDWDQGVYHELLLKLKRKHKNAEHTKMFNLEWVANHLYDDTLLPEEVPNSMALHFLVHARERSNDFVKNFLGGVKATEGFDGAGKDEESVKDAEKQKAERDAVIMEQVKALTELLKGETE